MFPFQKPLQIFINMSHYNVILLTTSIFINVSNYNVILFTTSFFSRRQFLPTYPLTSFYWRRQFLSTYPCVEVVHGLCSTKRENWREKRSHLEMLFFPWKTNLSKLVYDARREQVQLINGRSKELILNLILLIWWLKGSRAEVDDQVPGLSKQNDHECMKEHEIWAPKMQVTGVQRIFSRSIETTNYVVQNIMVMVIQKALMRWKMCILAL